MMSRVVDLKGFGSTQHARISAIQCKSLDAQSEPGMSYFSFKVQKCPIFKVLNLKKENFIWYFSCAIDEYSMMSHRQGNAKLEYNGVFKAHLCMITGS